MSRAAQGVRYAERERETGETTVRVVLDLDGGTRRDISTGIGFLDHMLEQFAFHGHLDLGIKAEGDLHVDEHHTVEDVGIVLGEAIREALQSDPIQRFGECHTPKDDALVLVAIDISGRGALHYDLTFERDKIGEMPTESIREFFQVVASNGGFTLHIRKIAGINEHHLCEAAFKGFGRALHHACRIVERRGPTSTKGPIF